MQHVVIISFRFTYFLSTATLRQIIVYSISQELYTWFMFCYVLLWFSTCRIYPYSSGLLHWHWGNHMIAPVPVKQPWRMWVNKSHELLRTDYINKTKQSITKPCTYFMGCIVPCCCCLLNKLFDFTIGAGATHLEAGLYDQNLKKYFIMMHLIKSCLQIWFLTPIIYC